MLANFEEFSPLIFNYKSFPTLAVVEHSFRNMAESLSDSALEEEELTQSMATMHSYEDLQKLALELAKLPHEVRRGESFEDV